ncbi:MAG: Secretion system C-terminal sorting domain, partial [Bacteroidota bacterium]|jgi:hypothetical protein
MSSPSATRISFVDTNGTLSWSQVLNHGYTSYQFIKNQNGGFYLLGHRSGSAEIIITKLGNSLDSIGTFSVGLPNSNERCLNVLRLNNGRLGIIGKSNIGSFSNFDDVYLAIIDSTGYSNPASLQNLGLNDQFVIYPNPSTNNFKIKINALAKVATLEIFNMAGVLMYTEVIESNATITSLLDNGVYTVRLTVAGQVYIKKLIIF